MKKAAWIIAVCSLALTAVLLSFFPETVPVHFDIAWKPDRWGTKYELLLLPVLQLVLTGCWVFLLGAQEKKAERAEDGKARASLLANRKAVGIAGITLFAVLTALQAWVLWIVHRSAAGAEVSGAALDKLPCILLGLLFIVLGNIMPKTRLNGVVGFRVTWSMYNDETWRRTHRFGGYAMVAAGFLTILACALVPTFFAAVIVTVALITAVIAATMLYARRVYTEVKERSEKGEN